MRSTRTALAALTALVGLVGGDARPAAAGPFDAAGHAPGEMVAWATDVQAFVAGPVDVAQPELGLATHGVAENALGPSDPFDSFAVVSLGDGGSLTLFFASGIGEAPGPDFAVFENGFYYPGGFFGEFAFVEVSSDGVAFARFPSTSLQASPVGGTAPIEPVDPTDYHLLAGDQPQGFGTGFDLALLWNDPLVRDGLVDLTDVRYVRLIDVIGDGSTLDGQGQPLYDPYPTAFASGGFDADAVGVIHDAPEPALGTALMLAVGGLAATPRLRRGRRAWPPRS